MRIETEDRGAVTIIRPEDRLDILGYLELEERLAALLAAGRSRLVLDLQEATFINSATLGVMSRFWADCAKAGGILVIARPSREARNFLRLGDVDELIDVFPSVGEAVAAAEQARPAAPKARSGAAKSGGAGEPRGPRGA
ncbi:MAG TPA: STAS domain-containing protein [Planctomycetota bacterium]|nr:STAS domain-containing protein [Planctomycetota bacterium]